LFYITKVGTVSRYGLRSTELLVELFHCSLLFSLAYGAEH